MRRFVHILRLISERSWPRMGDSCRWRVRYPEYHNRLSIPMCYQTACAYAKLFNGVVERSK